jgi:glucosamine-6-phosphate deaminase
MNLIISPNYPTLSQRAADIIAAVIAARPDATMVLATGDTPMGVYRELTARYQRRELDTSRLRIFQLDEYLGITEDDRRSLYGWLVRSFVEPLGIPPGNVVRLRGDTADPTAACRDYIQAVEAAGGFDLSVLGLGPNGHLGFNEPPCGPDAPTRVVDLTEASIESNARYWDGRDQVPHQTLTAGMDLLMAARQTLLVVSSARKRDILRRTLAPPPTPDVPASYLQQAANVTGLADRNAWPTDQAL